MAERNSTVTRRGFLARCGVAGAVGTLGLRVPTVLGADQARAGGLPWREAVGTHLPAIRRAYAAEVAAFAETLRPRFEAGELRAYRDEDERIAWEDSPQVKLEALVAARFGLEVERTEAAGWYTFAGDADAARFVLAASPHAESTDDTQNHACYHATDAATWDVIAYARAAGWYTPTADECEDPGAA